MCVDITSAIGNAIPITTSNLPYNADNVVAKAWLKNKEVHWINQGNLNV